MLYNPAPWRRDPRLTRLLPARIEQLSDGLAIPAERVLVWGFVGAVLSEVWTAQGGGTPTRALDVAGSLYAQLP
jgi:streptomycin 6-kinase